MDDIRIGIIGLGGICRARHVPGFRKIEGVRLCAVANRTRASSERAAREAGIPEVCGSWQELVARDDINTVVIGAWPYLHCEASVAALEAENETLRKENQTLENTQRVTQAQLLKMQDNEETCRRLRRQLADAEAY